MLLPRAPCPAAAHRSLAPPHRSKTRAAAARLAATARRKEWWVAFSAPCLPRHAPHCFSVPHCFSAPRLRLCCASRSAWCRAHANHQNLHAASSRAASRQAALCSRSPFLSAASFLIRRTDARRHANLRVTTAWPWGVGAWSFAARNFGQCADAILLSCASLMLRQTPLCPVPCAALRNGCGARRTSPCRLWQWSSRQHVLSFW